jgi:hypothetical protein
MLEEGEGVLIQLEVLGLVVVDIALGLGKL